MRKEFNFKIIVAILVCLMGGFLVSNKTNAYNCNSSVVRDNLSLKRACKVEGTPGACIDGECGAMWINGSKSTNAEDANTFSDMVDITSTADTVDVYLHGSVLYTNERRDGSWINIVEGKNRITGDQINNPEIENFSPFSFCNSKSGVNGVDCKMSRPGTGDPYKEDIKSSAMKITLNINDLRKKVEPRVTNKGNIYETNLQIYRCFGDPPSVGNQCYSDTSEFKAVIAPMFVGRSRVAYVEDGTTHESKTKIIRQAILNPKNQETRAETLVNNNCPSSGCNFTFRHYLKRETSDLSVQYTIERTSNFGESVTIVDSATFKPSDAKEHEVPDGRTDKTIKLKPGQVVCEKLTFFNADKKDKLASSTVCAAAGGRTEGSLDIKAKKNDEGDNKYLDYCTKAVDTKDFCVNHDDEIMYVKPGDKVSYQVEYDSAPQSFKDLKVDFMRLNGHEGEKPDTELWDKKEAGFSSTPTLQNFYNKIYPKINETQNKNLIAWNNAFTVLYSLNNRTTFNKVKNADQTFKLGEAAVWKKTFSDEGDRNSKIIDSDVGKTIITRAQTNHLDKSGKNIGTTPSAVSIGFMSSKKLSDLAGTSDDPFNYARLQMTYLKDEVHVAVPYNFRNETEIKADDVVLYAGEEAPVKFNVIVMAKKNEKVGAEYATKVPKGSRFGVVCSIEGSNEEIDCSNDGKSEGTSTKEWSEGENVREEVRVVIPDVPAGTRICLKSWVWPANSGADTNLSIEGFSKERAESAPVCMTVAKRPSLQVWGGNVYTDGNINTSVSSKKKLAGCDQDENCNEKKTHFFGSFNELGIISTGAIKGFASGAAMGSANVEDSSSRRCVADNRTGSGRAMSYGGSIVSGFCKRSLLTFSDCSSEIKGKSGGYNGVANNKNEEIGKLGEIRAALNDLDSASRPDYNISSDAALDVKGKDNIYYYYSEGGFEIGEIDLNDGIMLVAQAKGNINVSGKKIVYSGSYNSLEQVPKMVIYAGGDIKIACDVERIDALLIANGTVDTCPTEDGDYNKGDNSNQLIINGAVVSDALAPNRTYGTATGKDSVIPAEIINFDPTLYQWGSISDIKADVVNDSVMRTVYMYEMSPRY